MKAITIKVPTLTDAKRVGGAVKSKAQAHKPDLSEIKANTRSKADEFMLNQMVKRVRKFNALPPEKRGAEWPKMTNEQRIMSRMVAKMDANGESDICVRIAVRGLVKMQQMNKKEG